MAIPGLGWSRPTTVGEKKMNDQSVAPATLPRMAGHAMTAYVGCADGFEAEMRPEAWKVVSGEPVADLN
jgi:hypothetical protein